MSKAVKTAIEPTRSENFPEWYQQVVKAAQLAESSDVRGCMVIKPWGYGLWENMKRVLDGKFKETGHKNAYFPLFIPLSYLEKEAEHVDGFAKECAVVTHHRLEMNAEGKLVPAGELEEPYIVRPTSETIIGASFAKWVESYRDLPLLINQWANVVRWEMRPRLFLRTAEFLWQEGHTVHATEEEARLETLTMLEVYERFSEDYLAMPAVVGEKTESEKFPGAEATYCFEVMMQDGKSIQAGTSHFLGQKFAKASNIRFTDENGELKYGWTTSWGTSTRMIGGMIMTHSDDDGMRMPPRVAPAHVVIIPVVHKEETRAEVMAYCTSLVQDLQKIDYYGRKIEVEIDDRDLRGGEKTWAWVKKGIPLRVEIGPRDIASDSVFVARRDQGVKDKKSMSRTDFVSGIYDILEAIQQTLFDQADAYRRERTVEIDSKEAFYAFFTPKNKERPEIHGGFAMTHWNGTAAVEEQIKKDLNVTIRCVPMNGELEEGICPFSGEPSKQRVVFAKGY